MLTIYHGAFTHKHESIRLQYQHTIKACWAELSCQKVPLPLHSLTQSVLLSQKLQAHPLRRSTRRLQSPPAVLLTAPQCCALEVQGI